MARPVLEIRELWVRRQERAVCRGVDLRVSAGEVVGLVGGPGAGKSSLLACAGLELAASSGSVLLHGVDIAGATCERRRALRSSAIDLVRLSAATAPDRGPAGTALTGRLRAPAHVVLAGALAGPFDVVLADGVFDADADGDAEADGGAMTGVDAGADRGPLVVPRDPGESVARQVELVDALLRRRPSRPPAVVLASRSLEAVAAVADTVVVLVDGQVGDAGPVPQVVAGQRCLGAPGLRSA